MSTLLAIFLLVGAIGFIFLMVSVLIGDLFEFLDVDLDLDGGDGFSWFDTRAIAMFMTAFGLIGALTTYLEFGFYASIGSAVLSGLVLGSMVLALGYFLLTQQSNSSITRRELVGRTAKVLVAIRPGEIGQITIKVGEERLDKIARSNSEEVINEGETVFIEATDNEGFLVSSMKGYESEL